MLQITLNTIFSVTSSQSSITPHFIHSKQKAWPHPQKAVKPKKSFFPHWLSCRDGYPKNNITFPQTPAYNTYFQRCLTPCQLRSCWSRCPELTSINSLFSCIFPSSISMIDTIQMDSRHGNKMGFFKTSVVAIVKTQMMRWDNFSLCECKGGWKEEKENQ